MSRNNIHNNDGDQPEDFSLSPVGDECGWPGQQIDHMQDDAFNYMVPIDLDSNDIPFGGVDADPATPPAPVTPAPAPPAPVSPAPASPAPASPALASPASAPPTPDNNNDDSGAGDDGDNDNDQLKDISLYAAWVQAILWEQRIDPEPDNLFTGYTAPVDPDYNAIPCSGDGAVPDAATTPAPSTPGNNGNDEENDKADLLPISFGDLSPGLQWIVQNDPSCQHLDLGPSAIVCNGDDVDQAAFDAKLTFLRLDEVSQELRERVMSDLQLDRKLDTILFDRVVADAADAAVPADAVPVDTPPADEDTCIDTPPITQLEDSAEDPLWEFIDFGAPEHPQVQPMGFNAILSCPVIASAPVSVNLAFIRVENLSPE